MKTPEPIKAPELVIPSLKIPGQVPIEEFEETIPTSTDEGILKEEKDIYKGISELETLGNQRCPRKLI